MRDHDADEEDRQQTHDERYEEGQGSEAGLPRLDGKGKYRNQGTRDDEQHVEEVGHHHAPGILGK